MEGRAKKVQRKANAVEKTRLKPLKFDGTPEQLMRKMLAAPKPAK